MIIDEAHYLKNSSAQRTRAIYGPKIDLKGSPLEFVDHIWCLTGTPLLNHPAEFWTHLHALAPQTIVLSQLGLQPVCLRASSRIGSVSRSRHPMAFVSWGAGTRTSLPRGSKVSQIASVSRTFSLTCPRSAIVDHPLPADTEIEPVLKS